MSTVLTKSAAPKNWTGLEQALYLRVRGWRDRALGPLCRQLLRLGVTANALSLSRLAFMLLFVLAINSHPLALVLLSVALLTDALDGPVARYARSETRWSKLVDHASDQLALYLYLYAAARSGLTSPALALTCGLLSLLAMSLRMLRNRWSDLTGRNSGEAALGVGLAYSIYYFLPLLPDDLIGIPLFRLCALVLAVETLLHFALVCRAVRANLSLSASLPRAREIQCEQNLRPVLGRIRRSRLGQLRRKGRTAKIPAGLRHLYQGPQLRHP